MLEAASLRSARRHGEASRTASEVRSRAVRKTPRCHGGMTEGAIGNGTAALSQRAGARLRSTRHHTRRGSDFALCLLSSCEIVIPVIVLAQKQNQLHPPRWVSCSRQRASERAFPPPHRGRRSCACAGPRAPSLGIRPHPFAADRAHRMVPTATEPPPHCLLTIAAARTTPHPRHITKI